MGQALSSPFPLETISSASPTSHFTSNSLRRERNFVVSNSSQLVVYARIHTDPKFSECVVLCWVSVYFVFVSRSAVAVRKEPVEISLGISAAGNKTCRRKRREKLLLSMPVPRTGLGGPVAAAMQCRCALCYPFRCQILSCHCFGGVRGALILSSSRCCLQFSFPTRNHNSF